MLGLKFIYLWSFKIMYVNVILFSIISFPNIQVATVISDTNTLSLENLSTVHYTTICPDMANSISQMSDAYNNICFYLWLKLVYVYILQFIVRTNILKNR